MDRCAVSIYTPTNNPKYLIDAFLSIQECIDYEWVIVTNGDVHANDIPSKIAEDPHVRVIEAPAALRNSGNIGALKNFTVEQCRGHFLAELDHDDLLTPGILADVVKGFESNSQAAVVYTNWAEFDANTGKPCTYDEGWGWKYRDYVYPNYATIGFSDVIPFLFKEAIAPIANAHHMTSGYYTANHLRAIRRTDYDAVAGYDPTLTVADDMDLLCRLFVIGDFQHIDRCGYLYRQHVGNTWRVRCDQIADYIQQFRKKYLHRCIEAEARRKGWRMLDLGGRFNKALGYESVDRWDADINWDFEYPGVGPVPYDSVGVIRAFDFLEHLPNKVWTMQKIHRLLIPGGYLITNTPSVVGPSGECGRGAFQDPTHVSYWCANTFWYFTNPTMAQLIDNNALFHSLVLEEYYMTDWHKERSMPYVRGDFMAIKPGMSPMHGGVGRAV